MGPKAFYYCAGLATGLLLWAGVSVLTVRGAQVREEMQTKARVERDRRH